jgi:hypothetical protein
VKNPVSKFAFQVRNLQRYTVVKAVATSVDTAAAAVGLRTLNQVDP